MSRRPGGRRACAVPSAHPEDSVALSCVEWDFEIQGDGVKLQGEELEECVLKVAVHTVRRVVHGSYSAVCHVDESRVRLQ